MNKMQQSNRDHEKELTNLIIDPLCMAELSNAPKYLAFAIALNHIAIGSLLIENELNSFYSLGVAFQFLRSNNAAIKHFT